MTYERPAGPQSQRHRAGGSCAWRRDSPRGIRRRCVHPYGRCRTERPARSRGWRGWEYHREPRDNFRNTQLSHLQPADGKSRYRRSKRGSRKPGWKSPPPGVASGTPWPRRGSSPSPPAGTAGWPAAATAPHHCATRRAGAPHGVGKHAHRSGPWAGETGAQRQDRWN